jgi:AbiV family abortive infection protein
MDIKTFNSFDNNQLYEGLLKCRTSMFEHYGSAQALAENKFWGIANAHLILSAEEGIKSIVFLFKLCNLFNPPETLIKSLFSDHKPKHNFGKQFYDLLYFLSHFSQIYLIIRNINETEKIPPYIENWDMDLDNITPESMLRAMKEVENHSNSKKEVVKKWWKRANDMKNLGFYTKYENSKWHIPNDITEEEYNHSLTIIQPILQIPTTFFDVYRREWIKNFVKEHNKSKL